MIFYHCFLWILCIGILVSPINGGFSFGGTYCALSTCEGTGLTWCDSGCCTEHGVTHCCPNLIMVIIGSIFGTLLVLLVALTLIVIYLRRRRSLKLHAISCEEPPIVISTRTESRQRQRHSSVGPPAPERLPQLPSDDIMAKLRKITGQ